MLVRCWLQPCERIKAQVEGANGRWGYGSGSERGDREWTMKRGVWEVIGATKRIKVLCLVLERAGES